MEYELRKLELEDLDKKSEDKTDVIVLERSSHANKIFATVMYEYNRLNNTEWKMYNEIFEYLTFRMPKIDGIIYLDCDIEKSMNRLKQRNRNGEENVDIDYQNALRNAHIKWVNELETNLNQSQNHQNENENKDKYCDEFESHLGILRCEAKDFLENRDDLMQFNQTLMNFVEKQRNTQSTVYESIGQQEQ